MYTDASTPSEIMFKFIVENLRHIDDLDARVLVCQAGYYLIADSCLADVLARLSRSVESIDGSAGLESPTGLCDFDVRRSVRMIEEILKESVPEAR